jgi:hypothetical protein
MRGCFIDHGNSADFNLLRKHSIDTVLIPGEESPIANPTSIKAIYDAGFAVSVMFAWNWHGLGAGSGAEFAKYASNRLKEVGHPAVNPSVVLDIEKGAGVEDWEYVDWVVAALKEWRKLRPTRQTHWTLEAMQGGLFNGRNDAVEAIRAANVGIVPQFYTGSEYPMAADVALKDLLLYNFPSERIKGFYLARELPLNWDGYAWTQGKLPR